MKQLFTLFGLFAFLPLSIFGQTERNAVTDNIYNAIRAQSDMTDRRVFFIAEFQDVCFGFWV